MRSTVLVKCSWCGKQVEKLVKNVSARLKLGDMQKFYCDRKCAASRVRESVKCGTCGKSIEITPSRKKKSKSGISFCSKSCAAITLNTLGDKRGENHPNYTNGKASYRDRGLKEQCEECGESRYYLLVVHHRNSDRTDNDGKNWRTLCWNCHACSHLVVKNGKIVVRWNMLTTEDVRAMIDEMVTSSNVGCFPV